MRSLFHDWTTILQNAWLAPRCPICAAAIDAEAGVCGGCRAELPFLVAQCAHCALPLAETASARVCGECAQRPRFDHAHAAFHYQQPIAWLIGSLKYHRHLAHARLLGDLLAERLAGEALPAPDLIAPMPLHPAAFRRRGFNQAERIATRLARRLGWPLDCEAFARLRDTPRQSTLNAAQRAANVRGAFTAHRDLAERHIVLVDDVMTTTRSAAALARCARAAGAARVDVYCVARA